MSSAPQASDEALEWARTVLVEEGVASQAPRPRPLDWLDEVGGQFLDWLSSVFGLSAVASAALSQALAWLVGLGGLIVVGLILLFAWQRRRKAGAIAIDPELVVEEAAEPDWSRGIDWRQRLERSLRATDSRAALQAFWWWLFSALGVERPRSSSWTGHRLVEDAGRPDLLPLVRRLEALTYGREQAEIDGIAVLLGDIDERLAL